MGKDQYDGIKPGDVLSELELQCHNKEIYNNSLIAIPTGNVSTDGTLEFMIDTVPGLSNPIQNKDIKSLLGDNVSVTRIPIVSSQFVAGLDPETVFSELVGSAGFVIVGDVGFENRLRLFTGVTPGSSLFIKDTNYMNYQAGYEFRFGGTPRWSHREVPIDIELLAGLFDLQNGYAIGFAEGEEEWGFVRYNAGEAFFTPKSEFNIDKLDGTGPSKFKLDYTLGNIYRIRSLYFGYGPTILEVFTGLKWVTANAVIYPNTNIKTNISETYLPIGASVKNGANAADYYMDIASLNVSVLIDANARDVNNRVFTESFSQTVSGPIVNAPIISFRSKENIQLFGMPTAKENRIASDLRSVYMKFLDQNKEGTVQLVITPSADVTGGTFIDKDSDRSVLEVATDVTSVDLTNAIIVFEREISKTEDVVNIKAEPNDLRKLNGGFTASLLHTTQAVTTNITGTFGWDEQH